MIILIILLMMMYLIISYTSIYMINMRLLDFLRIILGAVFVVFIFIALMHLGTIKFWITLLALCLFLNIEISNYKFKFNDKKAKLILDLFSIVTALMIIVLCAIYL